MSAISCSRNHPVAHALGRSLQGFGAPCGFSGIQRSCTLPDSMIGSVLPLYQCTASYHHGGSCVTLHLVKTSSSSLSLGNLHWSGKFLFSNINKDGELCKHCSLFSFPPRGQLQRLL